MEVHESELLYQAGIGYMQAFSALHGHPNADIDKASEQTNKMYFDALSYVPFLTGGKSGTDMVMEDRLKSINEFKRRRDAMRKKPEDISDARRNAK
jgi:hypothetical protein